MGSPSLGYLAVEQIDEKYIGGIMVTDSRSIPLEFRYTDPIQPSAIHRIIFGAVLKPYLTNEVIKKTLLKDLRGTPDLLFLKDPTLLDPSSSGHPILCCLQATSLPGLEQPGSMQRLKGKEVLLQIPQQKSPLKLEFATPENDVQDQGLNILRSLFSTMDILEPFERLSKALQTLCKQAN